jgi:DNA primase
MLYGLPEARKLLHAGGEGAPLVAVEGYMDVIACQRAGVAAVASMGTALTPELMEALWRLCEEPTLCFDADRAGRAAAFRAIDGALPVLKPGRSFKFALNLGGKDPDDVLRAEGPAGLKARLADTTAFADLLFARERDAETLGTPERRAGLKQRLRRAANTIADPDLAQAYREDLLRRFDALFPPQPAAKGRDRRFGVVDFRVTDEGRSAARRLSSELDPLPAALVHHALADPLVLDEHLEDLQSHGVGDPTLVDLTREIIRLRLEAEHLDTDALRRHLAAVGFSALLTDIDRAAAKSGAPFIQSDVTLAAARSQWSHAFSVLNRLAALEDAMNAAKLELAAGASAGQVIALKTERDALRRAVKTGTIWDESGSF